jgi:(1->4)-alpha-D-glucan 1-alpha-D-glucosylmutase
MAKSLEDTAFYRFPLLLALNEVGGNPAAEPMPLAAFHAQMSERAKRWPKGLTATATHDTKRGEDARMRILALAELSSDWTSAIGRWKTLNARFVRDARGQRSPSIIDEYMIYQSLIGALSLDGITPDFVERFQQFMQKAVREEKLQSSWLNPNGDYESGIRAFVTGILDTTVSIDFLEQLASFAKRAALIGTLNSLSQLTLKATVPGVPDFYQGTELWDLSLVDPDNRRPVDFAGRAGILGGIDAKGVKFAPHWEDGTVKLAWTRCLLDLRHRRAAVFGLGSYRPLAVEGPHADHVIAFTRRYREHACSVVALRYFAPFARGGANWPDFRKVDARIGEMELDVGQLLGDFPAAVFPHDGPLNKTMRGDRVLSLA